MAVYAIEIVLTVLIIYGLAYVFYGRKILQERIVQADASRATPAFTKFDGVDYVPANKYVLYGHHFASIAGAGPIVGPAIAMAYGWALPLIWVLFGNVFLGAVHDYLSVMASVRYGGLSVMSISENVMGRKARYIFLVYVYAALILVIAAFASVAAIIYTKNPKAATLAIIYMPVALLLGVMIYRLGIGVKPATFIAIILAIAGFYYAYKIPLLLGYDPVSGTGDLWGTYHLWVIVLSLYAFIAASLPVWYLLQPRDYLNAYLLWFFVAFAAVGALLVGNLQFTGEAYTSFSPKIIGGHPTPFWPAIPLIIACGALSGFHSVVGSGTTSKQLSSEMDALLIGYGGMLTEGAVSSLAVIMPISLAWSVPELTGAVYKTSILELDKVSRFVVGYGYMTAKALERFGLDFNNVFGITKLFAAIALATFILTTLDTATRLARFSWQEMFDWLQPKNPGLYKVLTNRFVATFLAVLIGWALAYPTVTINGKTQAAYNVVWPAFAGTNQLLAALALLTTALWVYAILKVRGKISWLIQLPAWFLWVTVTIALIWWTAIVLPGLPAVQKYGAGSIVIVSLALDFLLIYYFVKGLRSAR